MILTRHGETLENRQDIMQGHLPGTLSPLGIAQAGELAELLKQEEIDHIVCSDLKRSYDTANIVAVQRNMTPRATPLLREIDWGVHTGGHLTQLDWKNLPEGCESLENLMSRAGAFIAWLKEQYNGKRVLVVGHGAINRAIIACLEGRKTEEMPSMPIMKNTSFVRFKL